MFTVAPKRRPTRPAAGQAGTTAAGKWETKRERENRRGRLQSTAAREIGPLPKCKNQAGRDACEKDLELFAKTYFPKVFYLPFGPDHRRAIEKISRAVLQGGQFALAMPRGSGKTSLCRIAAVWALLYGHRSYVAIVAATEASAEQLLAIIKRHFLSPDLLADFPEACVPLAALENDARRANGQLVDGAKTGIVYAARTLVLPTIAGSRCSGAIITTSGMTGEIRGQTHALPDGTVVRPNLVIVDDPQTRESARSPQQTQTRLSVITGDVLGLAGPGQKIAAVMPCTVIAPNDLADEILNRQRHPEWQGERCKMLISPPANQPLWDRYEQLRAEALRADREPTDATEFYRQNRAAMDEGAAVSWEERYDTGEISAIQNAMNLKIDRGPEFDAEYQNEPRRVDAAAALDPEAIMHRLSGYPSGTAGPEIETVVTFIDVGQDLLWWAACGFTAGFDAEVLDYGTWPEQRTRSFSAATAPARLRKLYPNAGDDGAVYAGLAALTDRLFARNWPRSDHDTLPIKRCLIDIGWKPKVIRAFIRQSAHRDRLTASRGKGIGPGQKPMAEYPKRPGEKLGLDWILSAPGPDRLRVITHDANAWKDRLSGMLTRPLGKKVGLLLAGDPPQYHQQIAHHLASEYPMPVTARGVTVDQWVRRPDADNHWLDTIVGCCVAANFEGIQPLSALADGPRGPALRLSELRRQRRHHRTNHPGARE